MSFEGKGHWTNRAECKPKAHPLERNKTRMEPWQRSTKPEMTDRLSRDGPIKHGAKGSSLVWMGQGLGQNGQAWEGSIKPGQRQNSPAAITLVNMK